MSRYSRSEYSTRINRYLHAEWLVSGFAFETIGSRIPACREDWVDAVLTRIDRESFTPREVEQVSQVDDYGLRLERPAREPIAWDPDVARSCPEYWRVQVRRIDATIACLKRDIEDAREHRLRHIEQRRSELRDALRERALYEQHLALTLRAWS